MWATWLEYKATCYSDITNARNHLFVSVNTLLLTVITVCLADILWFSDAEEKAHWFDSEIQKFPWFPPLTFGLQCTEGWNNLSELQRWDRSKGSSISLEALEVCRQVAGWVFFINSQLFTVPNGLLLLILNNFQGNSISSDSETPVSLI